MDVCGLLADLAAIATATVAVFWFSYGALDRRGKRIKLETYLRDRNVSCRNPKKDTYQHSVVHLMGKVGLTESELFNASFASPLIKRVLTEDPRGIANDILFEYCGSDVPEPRV
jgi:hypothetical protein